MKNLGRIICLCLIAVTLISVLSGCARAPKDEIQANIVTVEKKYIRDKNVTEIFFFFDILNGKSRSISKFEIDATITFRDGTSKNQTIVYDEKIEFARSSPLFFTYTVDGRADAIEILAYRFEVMNYWQTFGGFIITVFIIYIIIAGIMVALAMAEMDGLVAIGSGLLVLFCIAYILLAPFVKSIFVIIGTVIAFLPFAIFKTTDY